MYNCPHRSVHNRVFFCFFFLHSSTHSYKTHVYQSQHMTKQSNEVNSDADGTMSSHNSGSDSCFSLGARDDNHDRPSTNLESNTSSASTASPVISYLSRTVVPKMDEILNELRAIRTDVDVANDLINSIATTTYSHGATYGVKTKSRSTTLHKHKGKKRRKRRTNPTGNRKKQESSPTFVQEANDEEEEQMSRVPAADRPKGSCLDITEYPLNGQFPRLSRDFRWEWLTPSRVEELTRLKFENIHLYFHNGYECLREDGQDTGDWEPAVR